MWNNRERSPVVTSHHSHISSIASDGALYGGKAAANLRGVKLAAPTAEAMTATAAPSQSVPWQAPGDRGAGGAAAPKRQNLQELRGELFAMLKPAQQVEYCSLVSAFLNLKLSKGELDKLLPATIGPANVGLHNRLIRAVFSKACSAEPHRGTSTLPAMPRVVKVQKKRTASVAQLANEGIGGGSLPGEGLAGRGASPRMNGDAMACPARKPRSPGLRERYNSDAARPRFSSVEEGRNGADVLQNGAAADGDIMHNVNRQDRRSFDDGLPRPLSKRLRLDRDLQNEHMRPPYLAYSDKVASGTVAFAHRGGPQGAGAELRDHASRLEHDFPRDELEKHRMDEVEDMEEDEDDEEIGAAWLKEPIRPPLGIPFCKASPGAASVLLQEHTPQTSLKYTLLGEPLEADAGSLELPDNITLQRRMQRLVHLEGGLQAISSDAVQAVGVGLETFVKSIAAACIRLVKAKRHREQTWQEENGGGAAVGADARRSHIPNKAGSSPSMANGLWPHKAENLASSRAGCGSGQGGTEGKIAPISVQDLMVAVELNPRLLGDDIAIGLERIASYL